jgi:HTH-type transcriptional regulator, competence development regulator
MAGQFQASAEDASPAGFGAWLRTLREEKGAILRVMAVAADMDPSHLGKAERGERLPTLEQALALAKFLSVPPDEMRSRFVTAKLWIECGGDASLAADVASRVQEHAAAFLVNNRTNKK